MKEMMTKISNSLFKAEELDESDEELDESDESDEELDESDESDEELDVDILLLASSVLGDLDMVKIALRKGANINTNYYDGNSSFVIAAWRGHLDILKYLVNMPKFNAEDLQYALNASLEYTEVQNFLKAKLKDYGM